MADGSDQTTVVSVMDPVPHVVHTRLVGPIEANDRWSAVTEGVGTEERVDGLRCRLVLNW